MNKTEKGHGNAVNISDCVYPTTTQCAYTTKRIKFYCKAKKEISENLYYICCCFICH